MKSIAGLFNRTVAPTPEPQKVEIVEIVQPAPVELGQAKSPSIPFPLIKNNKKPFKAQTNKAFSGTLK